MISRRFLLFLVVGSIGFLVDAGILAILVHGHGWDPYGSRLLSFMAAVSVTWLLNRTLTFKDSGSHGKAREYRRYFLVQAAGNLINLLVYSLCIALIPLAAAYPVTALAVGSATAMTFNYLGAKHWVFGTEAPESVTLRGQEET